MGQHCEILLFRTPVQVTWTVSHPGVLQTVHPFGSSITEKDENHFAIWLEGGAAGSATVKVRVEPSASAKQHFIGKKQAFEDTVEIRVEEPLSMRRPEMPIPVIRLAQNSEIQLETAWPQSAVAYSVPSEYANRLSVTKNGIARAKSSVGPAAVYIRRTDQPDNETAIIPITIAAVNSLDVKLLTKLEPVTSTPLMNLPVGAKIALRVLFRDSRGRELSSSSKLSYRPHRFDLTDIVPSDANRTLTVSLKSVGETVLKVSLTKLFDFQCN
ncbi:unnamed protein product [Cylicostephanus goldi]|uniref:BIG2 domain-containing protein n=1 Tax=Cylicostephanus goldi TaxID=71465 RepID=A0A3P6R9X1_CYLGO|nr:unnamed protein product [Cylicostephanus goldi]